MPMRSGQMRRLVDAVVGLEHLARGSHRMLCSIFGLQRRAEQSEKAVAEELVHDAAVAVEDVDQHRKGAVEPVDHFLRRALAGAGGKAAEIDEHHGDATEVALAATAFQHQPLDHLRRDVLAEQVGDAVARGGGLDAGLELPAQLVPDGARPACRRSR